MPAAYYLGYEAPSRAYDLNVASPRDSAGKPSLLAVISMSPESAFGLRPMQKARTVEFTKSVGLLKVPRGTVITIGNCTIANYKPKSVLRFRYLAESPLIHKPVLLKSGADCPVL